MNKLHETAPQLVFDYLKKRSETVNPLLISEIVRAKHRPFYATRPEWSDISPLDRQFTLFCDTIAQLVQDYDLNLPMERAVDKVERKTYIGHLSRRINLFFKQLFKSNILI